MVEQDSPEFAEHNPLLGKPKILETITIPATERVQGLLEILGGIDEG